MFNLVTGLNNAEIEGLKKITREAVRAVILNDNKVLMIQTNKGDFKFPGGGIKQNESKEEALKREVEEESGYKVNTIGKRIGQVIERNKDRFEKDSIFEMKSTYFLCEVSDIIVNQQLDEYEAEQEFSAVWVKIDEAIVNNEELLTLPKEEINDWVMREIMVLREINK